ncbi:hypothetical protein BO71DRAFT_366832 [Aspergillus ellipticus CBS 707.79]|uniref:Uncharacterized protein n=1 Tax=Aspergillus ellipticus CBS 707.79 TaxID=1448320 RepID=A0A319E9E5_9EURO|nr:hypothetical protein BO71DRAFT_366832 [Aspergillus ellipticus CBS 707.79]
MDSPLDLTLPPTYPTLDQGADTNWDEAAFALYSMVALPPDELSNLLSTLNREWKQNMTDEAPPLVQTPAVYNFAGHSLREVVQAHTTLDKGFTPRDNGGAEGNIQWYPTAFIVVTSRDWEDKGLLFTYADEDHQFAMDRFFFKIEDAYLMLSSLNFGDETHSSCKENYGMA